MSVNRNIVLEFVGSLSDEDLKFLTSRLTEKLQGDIAQALELMSQHKSIDNVFSAAKSADEVFNLCDFISEFLLKECKKRGLQLEITK